MFFDLDNEIESFFKTSIERFQDRFLTIYSFHNETAKTLVHFLKNLLSTEPKLCDSFAAEWPDGRIPSDNKRSH